MTDMLTQTSQQVQSISVETERVEFKSVGGQVSIDQVEASTQVEVRECRQVERVISLEVSYKQKEQAEEEEKEEKEEKKKRLSIITEQEDEDKPKQKKKVVKQPMTARAQTHQKKIDLISTEGTEDDKLNSDINTPSSRNSGTNMQFTLDYLRNRDPMKEFFTLVPSLLNTIDLLISQTKLPPHERHLHHQPKHPLRQSTKRTSPLLQSNQTY